jgi:hypothetical protein
MTNYEKIISYSINDLAVWLDTYGQVDNAPWLN